MPSDPLADLYQVSERLGQACSSTHPLQTATVIYLPDGHVSDLNLHFNSNSTSAFPSSVSPSPASSRRRRLSDQEFVTQLQAAVRGVSPPGQTKADLAEKMTGSRSYSGWWAKRVDRAAAASHIKPDEDGFYMEHRP